MAKAGDMVQLAERFRQALAERAGTSEGTDWMDADMEAELISMGIASPVTKASAGALYHRELSRQVRAAMQGASASHDRARQVPASHLSCSVNLQGALLTQGHLHSVCCSWQISLHPALRRLGV